MQLLTNNVHWERALNIIFWKLRRARYDCVSNEVRRPDPGPYSVWYFYILFHKVYSTYRYLRLIPSASSCVALTLANTAGRLSSQGGKSGLPELFIVGLTVLQVSKNSCSSIKYGFASSLNFCSGQNVAHWGIVMTSGFRVSNLKTCRVILALEESN